MWHTKELDVEENGVIPDGIALERCGWIKRIQCDTGLSGAMRSAVAVALMPLVTFLLRTPQQWLTILFSGPDNPKHCPFPYGIWIPIEYIGPWAHHSHWPKRHLDPFVRLFMAHKRNQQTDKHTDTDRPRYSVYSNRPHPAIAAMRPDDFRNKRFVQWMCDERYLTDVAYNTRDHNRSIKDDLIRRSCAAVNLIDRSHAMLCLFIVCWRWHSRSNYNHTFYKLKENTYFGLNAILQ